MTDDLKSIDSEPSVAVMRPRFEGANIVSGIGFKHVMYLMEEAVIEHFRGRGFGPRRLFVDYGLCFEVTYSSARLLQLVQLDDEVRVEVRPVSDEGGRELAFALQGFAERGGGSVRAFSGKLKVMLRTDSGGGPTLPPPAALSPYVTAEVERASADAAEPGAHPSADYDGRDVLKYLTPAGANAFVWGRHIPYFYCHYSERIQHSGYLRLMEEVVELFLADRGISIRTMLNERRWIPIVADARVEILREAAMEETVYTVYTVEDIFKNVTYKARMDCYVERGRRLVHTATGRIVHGYAKILNREGGELVSFDEATAAALRGERR